MKSVFLLAMLAAPLTALADSPDASFYKNAAEGGIAEVEAGKLAQDKSSDPKLKDFAAMMVKDHSAVNDKLKGVASTKDVNLPTSSSVSQMASKAKLEVLTGDTFDKSYITDQIRAHRQTIALFKKEIASGQDPEAKAFAKATLPAVYSHLKAITAIATDKGIDTKQKMS